MCTIDNKTSSSFGSPEYTLGCQHGERFRSPDGQIMKIVPLRFAFCRRPPLTLRSFVFSGSWCPDRASRSDRARGCYLSSSWGTVRRGARRWRSRRCVRNRCTPQRRGWGAKIVGGLACRGRGGRWGGGRLPFVIDSVGRRYSGRDRVHPKSTMGVISCPPYRNHFFL